MNINDTLQYLNIGLPDDIARRKAWGDFEGAIRLIDLRLAQDNLSEPMRACLTAEREIICRIPQNYPFDRAAALAVVRAHIPDFTEEEFDERVDASALLAVCTMASYRSRTQLSAGAAPRLTLYLQPKEEPLTAAGDLVDALRLHENETQQTEGAHPPKEETEHEK